MDAASEASQVIAVLPHLLILPCAAAVVPHRAGLDDGKMAPSRTAKGD
jgi:hypothetical protein